MIKFTSKWQSKTMQVIQTSPKIMIKLFHYLINLGKLALTIFTKWVVEISIAWTGYLLQCATYIIQKNV